MQTNLHSQLLKSTAKDESTAILEVAKEIAVQDVEGIIFFCSSYYDLDKLNQGFNKNFSCQIVGCTTAGEIYNSYETNSLVVLVLSSKLFAMHSVLIEDVHSFNLSNAMKVASQLESQLTFSHYFDAQNMFGFLLTDGLSLKEERVTSLLNQVMGNVNIIGGSAGDDLEFNNTYIYSDNKFNINASVLIILELKADFEVYRMQHFAPTNKELITTEVDFQKRIVKEINGEPAATAYANINDLDVNNLNSEDFAMYPLMLNIANNWYIRSISKINPDKSLSFYCAIDNGLPLSIAQGTDLIKRLADEVRRIEKEFEHIFFTLGCDCILRKVEIISKGYTKEVEALLKRINFIGFSSYGEQYNGIHFNQTMVGTVVGKRRNVK